MTGRERIAAAMRHEKPDRVPVMCQLSLGHYFLYSGYNAEDIWHDSRAFANALITMQQRYEFDGVLINLPGREPNWRAQHQSVLVPPDDLPITESIRPSFSDVIPEDLYYVEPYGLPGLTIATDFPDYQLDTIRFVRSDAPDVSVHSEVFSPFSQLLELLGYTDALMALIDDAPKVKACLDALSRGTVDLMRLHASCDVDAILISSAFAGAGFISREHYREFVLPFEQHIISQLHATHPHVPVYTHTCGAIGDRLDLMQLTGTNGIDTLDPPPLGTVDFADAVRQLGGHVFIKGNIDPVNTLLNGSATDVDNAARERIALARDTYGFILSTSCSVAPRTPAENIHALVHAAHSAGAYA